MKRSMEEGDIIGEALLTDVDPSPAIPLQCSQTPPKYISLYSKALVLHFTATP